MEKNCIAQCITVDAQGDSYMARNCTIEIGSATLEELHNHQHCEVLMGQRVADN